MNDESNDLIETVEAAGAPEPESETAPAASPRLILKRGGVVTDSVFPFTPPATVGRFDPSVGPIDVDLGTVDEGAYVSRKHARIEEANGEYTITDLGSSNGTYVLRGADFERVESGLIADGDEVAFGNARFIFRVEP